MKRLYKLFALVALFFGASVALATSAATNVTVTGIEATSSGLFFVIFGSAISSPPACATNATTYVIDGTTAGGKEEIAVAELAYSLGKTVTASGANSCALYTGVETMYSIHTTD